MEKKISYGFISKLTNLEFVSLVKKVNSVFDNEVIADTQIKSAFDKLKSHNPKLDSIRNYHGFHELTKLITEKSALRQQYFSSMTGTMRAKRFSHDIAETNSAETLLNWTRDFRTKYIHLGHDRQSQVVAHLEETLTETEGTRDALEDLGLTGIFGEITRLTGEIKSSQLTRGSDLALTRKKVTTLRAKTEADLKLLLKALQNEVDLNPDGASKHRLHYGAIKEYLGQHHSSFATRKSSKEAMRNREIQNQGEPITIDERVATD